MKKIYQSPATMLVKVNTQKMIAASSTGVLENGFNTTNANPLDNSITGGNLSRHGKSLWDFDEDEVLF